MGIADPLRRVLRARRQGAWQDVAARYLARPLEFWGTDAPRHAEKLENKKRAVRDRDGGSDADVIDTALSMAYQRRTQRPAPVYITGLGGSGSHWVSGMLHDLGGLVAAGEVYFPKALTDALAASSIADQACAVDAVHLVHGWPRTPDIAAASIVNCAAGVHKLPRYKSWDPDAIGVYLVRDPRDQVLSVTFRKPAFRRYEDPDASDEQYLVRMAQRNAASYEQYRAVAEHVDIVCRYEDLCRDPRPLLRDVLSRLHRSIDDDVVDRTAVKHDAATIRAGTGSTITNLDGGGRARSWHEVADPAQRRILHAHLRGVITGLGYPPDDGFEPSG